MNSIRWLVIPVNPPNVIPEDDLREHELSMQCWCCPVEDSEFVVVHNSMDRREEYEHGQRKFS